MYTLNDFYVSPSTREQGLERQQLIVAQERALVYGNLFESDSV